MYALLNLNIKTSHFYSENTITNEINSFSQNALPSKIQDSWNIRDHL